MRYVLVGLPGAALRRKIRCRHLCALGVHHLGISGGAACDLEEGLRVEAEAGREHQTFGERDAVEPENQIDRELGAATVAGPADVEAHRKDYIEHARDLCRNGGIATDESDAVAAPHLLAGAGHRRFEEPQSMVFDAARKRCDAVGIAGRGAHHDPAGAVAEGCEDRPLHHLFHLVGVEHGEDDRIGLTGDVADRRCGAAAERDEGLCLRRVDVAARHIEAGGNQAARQHASHQTETDDTD
jgi:hypothetical protein